MAERIELAKAYVTIVPSLQGSQQTLTDELTGASTVAGQQAGSAAGSVMSRALGVAAAAGSAAISAAATGLTMLTRQAVEAYAEFEQLEGGISTLYGDAASQMMNYATEAASATGQSMNEYMEAAISTSAAMIAAVEGDQRRAAELTNLAMIDMADNANKLGTDMEAIQNAYRGFSRGNFTMLDNLALGYAGSAQGMAQLLADAEAISGVHYNINSYADIVEAIHTIQDEMEIAGATANEASSTISGSLGALSASWQNLVTNIANPDANLGTLIDTFVANAGTALQNLSPVVTSALSGISNLVQTISPILVTQLQTLVPTVLPTLLTTAGDLIKGLISGIIAALPELAPIAADLVVDFTTFILENLPSLITAAIEIVVAIVNGISQALPELIPVCIDAVTQICTTLIDHVDEIVAAAIELCLAIGLGMIAAIPDLVGMLPEIGNAIRNFLVDLGPTIGNAAFEWGGDLIESFVNGITGSIGRVRDAVSSIASEVRSYIGFSEPDEGPLSDFHTFAPDMIDLFTEGIEDSTPELEAALQNNLVMPTVGAFDTMALDTYESASDSDSVTPVNIYIGQEKLDTIMLRTSKVATYRRGG